MKKIIVSLICIAFANILMAQTYNNEWIDYNKTYYKFKLGQTGLCRINQNVLAANNLGNINAEQFQLWRNGVQVPLFVSNVTGVLTSTDFIEFYGLMNDGKMDIDLYKIPTYQLSNKLSLLTDTAAYYLTYETNVSNNLRYTLEQNNVATNTLPDEKYFIHNLRFNFKEKVNRGYALNVGEDVYSSSYDLCEFLCTKDINVADGGYKIKLGYLYKADMVGIDATMIAGVAGNSNKNRVIKIDVNATNYYSKQHNGFSPFISTTNNIPLSIFNDVNDSITIKIVTSDLYDRAVASFVELQYPRKFNFDNKSSFEFSLPANPSGNYLKIENFNAANSTAVLYDFTNLKYYVADNSNVNYLQFAIPPTGTTTNYVLVAQSSSNITLINDLKQRNFINYSLSNNQGDYIIISNKILMSGSNNAVEQYKNYRTSVSGGNYAALIVDIDEIEDQFAFGVKKHPFSVRNYLRFASTNQTIKPKNVFLIGKAVTYDEYRMLQNNPNVELQNLVPTFGWPASDALLVSPSSNPNPLAAFGRLSAINQQEILDYLDKVKQYETQGSSTLQTIANKAWMKKVTHVAGADDLGLRNLLLYYLGNYENIVKDSSFGGSVTTLSKKTGASIDYTQGEIAKLFEDGMGLLTYFGHSSAGGLAFNLNTPEDYNNIGKYPVFLVNGCSAGNFFDFDNERFNRISSLAERFVFLKNKGSVAFIATSHFGITSYLDYYSNGFYNSFSKANYGKTIGENCLAGIDFIKVSTNNFNDYFGRTHGEQFLLHGDPVIKINSATKPDYAVEADQVKITPTFVSILNNSFNVKASIYNLGKVTNDSIKLIVSRKYPNGSSVDLINKNIAGIRFDDDTTINIDIPINPLTDKGNNSLTITIDADYKVDELSEVNNSITKQFVIYEDEITPIFPYNYSIINKQNIKLVASTANCLAADNQYVFEIDTTTFFNSNLKKSKTINSVGGSIEFDPQMIFKDSVVYYWRVGIAANTNIRWANSSFVYLQNATTSGFNQSHFYQNCESGFTKTMVKDSINRTFDFITYDNSFTVHNSVYPYHTSFDIVVNESSSPKTTGSCWREHNIVFTVYEANSLKEMFNCNSGSAGQFGSQYYTNGCSNGREYDFSFSTNYDSCRKAAMDFMDNIIPNNSFVVVRSTILDDPFWGTPTFANDWKQDEAIYGAGNSLYHKLKNAGFNDIDSFNKKRAFSFIYQKNNSSFLPQSAFSVDSSDVVTHKVYVKTKATNGTIVSPKFGPATKWYNMLWTGNAKDVTDLVDVKLLGFNVSGTIDTLFTYDTTQLNNDISMVNANTYPYLKIVMNVKDTNNFTAFQLKYWRLLADVLPEGSLMPINFVFKDTLQKGELQQIAIPFKNISNTDYSDSLTVKLNITDNNNVTTTVAVPKIKKLNIGAVDTIKTLINSSLYPGNNTFFVTVNDSNYPKEITLKNNFAFKKFYVIEDIINPILEVTFDGQHILNNDIVSSSPYIKINLKDESKFQLLNDTSNISIQVKFPDGTLKKYKYDNSTLRFNAATQGNNNLAFAEFTPNFTVDGSYELLVQSKDKSNNKAGPNQYRVLFNVNTKPMISNVFNYPNPFTTSTAFVFTLTGNKIPDNFKIQILTITGKIVKEITKTELGTLRIGKNITDYKWDGTDMFGAALGNGVYLYRVVTTLDGKAFDKFNTSNSGGEEINTDNFFKEGYGKMYLMR